MLYVRRIAGQSMAPTLKQGQIVVGIRSKTYNPSQIVIAKQNDKEVIKRIASKSDEGFYTLIGDNAAFSSDSRKYGAVKGKDILAKVILVF